MYSLDGFFVSGFDFRLLCSGCVRLIWRRLPLCEVGLYYFSIAFQIQINYLLMVFLLFVYIVFPCFLRWWEATVFFRGFTVEGFARLSSCICRVEGHHIN